MIHYLPLHASAAEQVFVGLHLLVTRQEGVLFLKDQGVLVQEIASVRVSRQASPSSLLVLFVSVGTFLRVWTLVLELKYS